MYTGKNAWNHVQYHYACNGNYQQWQAIATVRSKNITLLVLVFFRRSDHSGNIVGEDQGFWIIMQ